MALSNIFNEPRREITETAVGFAIVAPVISVWVATSLWMARADYSYENHPIACTVLAFFLVLMGMMASFAILSGFFLLVHSIGEGFCDALQRRGIHLRPRRR